MITNKTLLKDNPVYKSIFINKDLTTMQFKLFKYDFVKNIFFLIATIKSLFHEKKDCNRNTWRLFQDQRGLGGLQNFWNRGSQRLQEGLWKHWVRQLRYVVIYRVILAFVLKSLQEVQSVYYLVMKISTLQIKALPICNRWKGKAKIW